MAEIGIDPGTSVTLAGDPPRLLVLAPSGALHIVDPVAGAGPCKVAELQVERGSSFAATSGSYALVAAANGPWVVSLAPAPAIARFPTRSELGVAAASTQIDHFVVQISGALEEWSAARRAPLRRFRFERPLTARHVGGGVRQVWFISREEPNLLVVLPLVGVGRPARIRLPEPALCAAADPAGATIAVVGAETGAVVVVACSDGTITSVHPGRVSDLAWCGTQTLACVCDTLVELVELQRSLVPEAKREPPSAPPPPPVVMSTFDHLAAWKEKARRARPADADHDASVVPPQQEHADGLPTARAGDFLVPLTPEHEWRDALAAWTRRSLHGSRGEPPLLAACALHDVGARLGLLEADRYFLWFLYGARLCGLNGVAPVDLVDLCPHRWDDALGHSRLAGTGAFVWRRNRIHLVPEVSAALDQIEPMFGTITASAATVTRRIAVVAPTDQDFDVVGKWAAPEVGALIAPTSRGLREPRRFLLEARVRGLAALVPWGRIEARALTAEPAVIVVDRQALADQLELPVALTWPG